MKSTNEIHVTTGYLLFCTDTKLYDLKQTTFDFVKGAVDPYGSPILSEGLAERILEQLIEVILDKLPQTTFCRLEAHRPNEIEIPFNLVDTSANGIDYKIEDFLEYVDSTFQVKLICRPVSARGLELIEQDKFREAVNLSFQDYFEKNPEFSEVLEGFYPTTD